MAQKRTTHTLDAAARRHVEGDTGGDRRMIDDRDEVERIDAMMRRLGEIEAMAGLEMTQREARRLMIEHWQLAIAIPAAESRRLSIKAAQMEAEERRRQCGR